MKKTLLILGAGASKDIYTYFPSGLELIKEINSFLTIENKYGQSSGDGYYLSGMTNEIIRGVPNSSISEIHLLKQHLWDHVRHYEYKYLRFNYEKNISIDYFIHDKIKEGILNTTSKAIVQYAISYLLIGYEEALKHIFVNEPYQINKNWVYALSKKLESYSMSQIKQNIHLISFNYERTFSYLFSNYKPDSLKDEFLFNNINYIYGSLGDLRSVPFGLKNDTTKEMAKVHNNFKLIDIERRPLSWDLEKSFDQIFFLGFGYDRVNLNNLNIQMFPDAIKIGTGRNLSKELRLEIKKNFGIEILQESCTDLIEKYLE